MGIDKIFTIPLEVLLFRVILFFAVLGNMLFVLILFFKLVFIITSYLGTLCIGKGLAEKIKVSGIWVNPEGEENETE